MTHIRIRRPATQEQCEIEYATAVHLVGAVGERTYIVPKDADKGVWGVLINLHADPSGAWATYVPDDPQPGREDRLRG